MVSSSLADGCGLQVPCFWGAARHGHAQCRGRRGREEGGGGGGGGGEGRDEVPVRAARSIRALVIILGPAMAAHMSGLLQPMHCLSFMLPSDWLKAWPMQQALGVGAGKSQQRGLPPKAGCMVALPAFQAAAAFPR